jgi:hypothetical protein
VFSESVQIELSRRGGCLPYQLILNSWDSSHIFFLIGYTFASIVTHISFMNSIFQINIFVMISGLLTAYTTSVYAIRCNGRVNLVKYVAKRLIRLLPPIVLPILLMSLMPLLPNGGPVYNSSTTRMRETCAQNWWKNLLFISNLLDPNDTVIIIYLSCSATYLGMKFDFLCTFMYFCSVCRICGLLAPTFN